MVRTRSTDTSPVALIPEIERSFQRARRATRATLEEEADVFIGDLFEEEVEMANQNQRITLESLTAPDLEQQNRAVTFPALADGQRFELKTGVVNLLPKFSGSALEDPIQHLDEFVEVCTSLRPTDISEEQMKMRSFSFSLKESAKDWYHTLAPGSITTWVALKKAFLEKYFPATKSNQLKKKISNIEQFADESLYDYYERFKKLVKACPYHGYQPS